MIVSLFESGLIYSNFGNTACYWHIYANYLVRYSSGETGRRLLFNFGWPECGDCMIGEKDPFFPPLTCQSGWVNFLHFQTGWVSFLHFQTRFVKFSLTLVLSKLVNNIWQWLYKLRYWVNFSGWSLYIFCMKIWKHPKNYVFSQSSEKNRYLLHQNGGVWNNSVSSYTHIYISNSSLQIKIIS